MLSFASLKPKSKSENQLKQDNMITDVVTVVREDGKEVLIQTSQLANHLERGFRIKENIVVETIKKATKKKTK